MSGLELDSCRFVETLEDVLRRGYSARFRASGWSMHPAIRDGEMITVEPVGQSPIRPGDVLLYRHGRGAIAHRVVRIRSSSAGGAALLLRGDAADSCDAPIALEQILGRVTAVGRPARPLRRDLLSRGWSRARARAMRGVRAALGMAAALRAGPSEERT